MPQITLTLKSEEGIARPEEMRDALRRLIAAGLLPSTGMKMTFQVESDDSASDLEELLTAALEDRSWVVEAEIEIKSKRGIKRKIAEKPKAEPLPTPMEQYLAQMA